MKRLLLVSYGFPPVSRVQSQGAAKLAKGLASRGWEVHALTVADPPTHLFDETLVAELPGNVITHTAYSLEPTRALQWLRRRRGSFLTGGTEVLRAAPERSYTSLPPGLVRLMRALFFPEEKVGWAPFALREARRLNQRQPFDAVVSTGPPYTAHLIAHAFARRTGTPWAAVLMDPIVGCYAFPPVTPLHAWLFRRLEAEVARDAAIITAATQPWLEALLRRNPGATDRVMLLPNGFDPADFEDEAPAKCDGFTISYVGTFQLSIRPDTFLAAVERLLADDAFARDLRIRFVGPRDPRTDAQVAARGLEDRVERTGLLPHREAIREMRSADALLFVLGPEPESAGILTGKLPEYLASGSTVLAETPAGVASELIKRAGAGPVVAPGDVEGMTQALAEVYRLWRTGALPRADAQVVAALDRTRAIERFDEALSAAASMRSGS